MCWPILFFYLDTQKNYISQLPLLLVESIWLGSGQKDVNQRDKPSPTCSGSLSRFHVYKD